MIDINEMIEVNQTYVLKAMGDSLIKEYELMQYDTDAVYMEEDVSKVNGFKRVCDFVSRCITRIIAWIKKGQLKAAREKLEKAMKNPKKNNFYQDDNDQRTMYTKVYPAELIDKEVYQKIIALHSMPLAEMIHKGDAKAFDRKEIEKQAKDLAKIEKEMRNGANKLNHVFTPKMTENSTHKDIKVNIDLVKLCETDVYNDLIKCFSAIKVVKQSEKERNTPDSKAVYQQYTHAMTLLAQCFLHEMSMMQAIAHQYNAGASQRSMSKKGKPAVQKNLTVEQLFSRVRNVMNHDDEAKNNGVWFKLVQIDTDHHRVEIIWKDADGDTQREPLACDQVTSAARSFIMSHASQSAAVKEDDLT